LQGSKNGVGNQAVVRAVTAKITGIGFEKIEAGVNNIAKVKAVLTNAISHNAVAER
jgi:hypothetical protein